jgi:thymidylate kinase
MRLIEFLGAPGSGKSTTLGLLEADAPSAGIRLQLLDPVGRIAIARQGRDPVTRAVARTVGRYWRSVWKRAMVRSSDRVAILSRAVVKRPGLATAIIEANDAHNHDAGADRVMGMLLNHLIGFQLAEETLDDRDWLLLDEGLCNRVTSLFAAGFDTELDRAELDRYLDLIPVPDVLVVVTTPIDVCFDRLEKVGWTERMAGKPAESRRAFLQRSSELVEVCRRHMEAAGSTVVLVDGTIPPRTAVPAVIAAIRGVGALPRTGSMSGG